MEASLAVVQMGITLVGATRGGDRWTQAAIRGDRAWLQRMGCGTGAGPVLGDRHCRRTVKRHNHRRRGVAAQGLRACGTSEWVCLRLSPAMRWFAFTAWPAVWLFERTVRAFMSSGEHRWQVRLDTMRSLWRTCSMNSTPSRPWHAPSRLIGGREEGIILNAARLSSRPVREIVLPAEHIAMLNLADSMAESLVAASTSTCTLVSRSPNDQATLSSSWGT